jgi:hypothetical protein
MFVSKRAFAIKPDGASGPQRLIGAYLSRDQVWLSVNRLAEG